jgi:hypothetical protein
MTTLFKKPAVGWMLFLTIAHPVSAAVIHPHNSMSAFIPCPVILNQNSNCCGNSADRIIIDGMAGVKTEAYNGTGTCSYVPVPFL